MFSAEFKKKAASARKEGFNIYSLSGKFYKQSKVVKKLPDAVLEGVLDEFLSRKEVVRDFFPYFLRVLQRRSGEHFASEAQKEHKKNEFSRTMPQHIRDILKNI